MAMMKHREDNMVRWVGVKPGHRGEQVVKSQTAVSNDTVTIHTVTADKVFMLTGWTLGANMTGAVNLLLRVKNDSAVVQYQLFGHRYSSAAKHTTTKSYWPPIELASEWLVELVVNTANGTADVSIHGWEEDE